MHKGNPDITCLARALNRTPSAVAMKMVNFASLDPAQKQRNIRGLSHASRGDRAIWDEFHADWDRLAYESQRVLSDLGCGVRQNAREEITLLPSDVPTEKCRMVRVRVVQAFFRQTVMAAYEELCAVCNLGLVQMLNASHIIPWSESEALRADPCNGLCLCALHDRAFDRGLITVDENHRLLLSNVIRKTRANDVLRVAFKELDGRPVTVPKRFPPDASALEYHRQRIFVS
jgi:predicted restriction endonuclease